MGATGNHGCEYDGAGAAQKTSPQGRPVRWFEVRHINLPLRNAAVIADKPDYDPGQAGCDLWGL
jgi:hypothetical protein